MARALRREPQSPRAGSAPVVMNRSRRLRRVVRAALPWLRRLALWTFVCGLSAAPSFLIVRSFTNEAEPTLGMICGVAVYVLAYTAGTANPTFRRLRSLPFAARTLVIGYGTRLAMSVAGVVAVLNEAWDRSDLRWLTWITLPDIYAGAWSCRFVSWVLASIWDVEDEDFVSMFAATVVEGAILNAELLAFMLLVLAAQRLLLPTPPTRAPGHCRSCGYDLRGNLAAKACAECGASVVINNKSEGQTAPSSMTSP